MTVDEVIAVLASHWHATVSHLGPADLRDPRGDSVWRALPRHAVRDRENDLAIRPRYRRA